MTDKRLRGGLVAAFAWAGMSGIALAQTCPDPHIHHKQVMADTDYYELGWWTVAQGTTGPATKQLMNDYDPEKDQTTVKAWEYTDATLVPGSKASYRDPDGHYESYDPFDDSVKSTDGAKNVDALGVVGVYILRKKAPYGDLKSKGWFGSDEYDDLTFELNAPEGRFQRTDGWSSACPHSGRATLRNMLKVRTRNVDIGGGAADAGTITPFVSTGLTNFGVAGGDMRVGEIQYAADTGNAVVVKLGASAGYNTAKEGGGKFEAGAEIGTTIPTSTGYMTLRALPVVEKSGIATSVAENKIVNNLSVSGATNDRVVAWEIHTVNREEVLEIREGS